LKLTTKLFHINTMLGSFTSAYKDHGNIPAVTFFENLIFINIYFTERGAEFAHKWRDGRFGVFAKMAARPRVKSHLARTCGG